MVIAHLAGSELVGAFRLPMILAHDRPPLAPYDQDLWATRLHYERANEEESVERRASSGCAASTPATIWRIDVSWRAFVWP